MVAGLVEPGAQLLGGEAPSPRSACARPQALWPHSLLVSVAGGGARVGASFPRRGLARPSSTTVQARDLRQDQARGRPALWCDDASARTTPIAGSQGVPGAIRAVLRLADAEGSPPWGGSGSYRRRMDDLPLLSTRKNGDRLVGFAGPHAVDLYAAGTPPMHGLAASPAPATRVRLVRVGDVLTVGRDLDRWYVRDGHGVLGALRWRAADDGRRHAVSGVRLLLPMHGTLRVERLVLSPDGVVKDFGGAVTPV